MAGSPHDHSRLPSKILMTADAVGGVWQYSLDLIRALAQNGTEVLLATIGPRPSEQQRAAARALPSLTLAESDFALEWMPDAWDGVDRCGEWLLDLQAEFGADVIHLNGYSHAALTWNAPTVTVAHSCVYSWWQAVHGGAPGADWAEYKLRVTAGLNGASAIVAPSCYMADAVAAAYGVAREKITVIYNSSAPAVVSRRDKQPVILAAGRLWDPAKNLTLLDRIAPTLDWTVQVAGSTEGPDQSQARAPHVQCLGPLPHHQLLTELAHASIFAHPALYEPFGLSALEAANAGCCLVLSGIPSLRELWDEAAVFVDPRDPEEWAYELNSLTRDFTRRRALARAARRRAARYTAEHMVKAYSDLYQSLEKESVQHRNGVAA